MPVADGLLLRSPVIPDRLAHGFSTRAGGVSPPPFDSLNLGGKWGDDPGNVAENRRRLRAAVGGPPNLYVARQVHGANVVEVKASDDPRAIGEVEADAVITAAPGVAVGVFVADCIPALIADPVSGWVGAVHAGWRGTLAGVLPATVRALVARGARAADLRVALGPAIGPCCFEVGADVAERFAADVVRPSPSGRADKRHVDLKAANRRLLEAVGVDAGHIDASAECTHCDRVRFYSFRRDGSATGQLMGVIVAP
jgi:YfiH family protein